VWLIEGEEIHSWCVVDIYQVVWVVFAGLVVGHHAFVPHPNYSGSLRVDGARSTPAEHGPG